MADTSGRNRTITLTRREFVGALAPLVAGLAACDPEAEPIPDGAVLLGLYAGDGGNALRQAIRRCDMSWLKAGDSVLIKVAVNSGLPHPSTTNVSAVSAMVAELKARGAGRVIVADQSGVEYVRSSQLGRFGSTRALFDQNGLSGVTQAGAELHFFDDQPFSTGYFPATLPAGHHWPRGMYLPSIIRSVQHIIYMPRIATHVLAGNTLGQKMAIGWLRDDSRHDVHNDASLFYEKYAEINYTQEIASRLRLAITVSEKVLLHGGPDHGTPYSLNAALVHASSRLVNHDAIGASVLATLNRQVTTVAPGAQVYNPLLAPVLNSFFADGALVATGLAGRWVSSSPKTTYAAHAWEQNVSSDRAIARGWAASGGKPANISVVQDGAPLDAAVRDGIVAHGGGLYVFS